MGTTFSWRKIPPRPQRVELGKYNESTPPMIMNNALLGVEGSASGIGHKGSQGFLDEEKASDEDEPDD